MNILPTFSIITLLIGTLAIRYEKSLARADAGEDEVKELPAVKAIEADGASGYFESGNDSSRTLSRYISQHDVAMTTPGAVE